MLKCRLVKFCLVFVSMVLIVACASADKKLTDKKCGSCHNLAVVYNKSYTEGTWKNIITSMKLRGMNTSASQDAQILKYLTEKHGA